MSESTSDVLVDLATRCDALASAVVRVTADPDPRLSAEQHFQALAEVVNDYTREIAEAARTARWGHERIDRFDQEHVSALLDAVLGLVGRFRASTVSPEAAELVRQAGSAAWDEAVERFGLVPASEVVIGLMSHLAGQTLGVLDGSVGAQNVSEWIAVWRASQQRTDGSEA